MLTEIDCEGTWPSSRLSQAPACSPRARKEQNMGKGTCGPSGEVQPTSPGSAVQRRHFSPILAKALHSLGHKRKREEKAFTGRKSTSCTVNSFIAVNLLYFSHLPSSSLPGLTDLIPLLHLPYQREALPDPQFYRKPPSYLCGRLVVAIYDRCHPI